MADVITRLRVESQEYDAKLKRATQALNEMTHAAEAEGNRIAVANRQNIAFAQSLGKMQTAATSAKGKMAELSNALTDATIAYNRLSKAEKSSPFGKALLGSIEQLRGRVGSLRAEMDAVRPKIDGNSGLGGALERLGGKIGLPVGNLSALGGVMAAAGVAAKVAADAFRSNEEAMDEWGRVTEAAGSVYQGFLHALNSGDFSGFFSSIGRIIKSAREAYDALDDLGTFNAFNQINEQKARTAFTESVARYREGNGSGDEVRAAVGELRGQLETRKEKEQAAYLAEIKKIANTKGVDPDDLRRVLEAGNDEYERAKSVKMTGRREVPIIGAELYGPQTKTEEYAVNAAEKLGAALRQLTDTQLDAVQKLGLKAEQTRTEIAQIDKQAARVLSGEGKKQPPKPAQAAKAEEILPEGSIAELEKRLADARKQFRLAADDGSRQQIQTEIDGITQALDRLNGKQEKTFAAGSLNDLQQQLKAAQDILNTLTPGTDKWATALDDVKAKTQAVKELQQQIADGTQQVADKIKSAADMWNEHQQKLNGLKAQIMDFRDMAADTSLGQGQRDWAAGMAEQYEEELKKMENATADTTGKMSDAFDNFKDGVGAVHNLVGSIDSLKGIGEDLADVFSGDMDAWDSLMAVIESGLGILDTVVSVYEAINTLTEIGTALKAARTAADATEAATAQASAATEVAAEGEKAAASATTAGVKTGEAAASAGNAMAGIPIVGPILAVAAIAAVLAAIIAAISKGKSSAGKYAEGGIIPGNSLSGDNQWARVNAGEVILNRAQQSNIAAQLTAGNPMSNMHIETRLSGEDIRIVLANNSHRRGGPRNAYAISH